MEILDAASHLIEEGSKQVKGAPSAAKRAYVEAINKYASVKPNDPELLLRRYRGLTAAELGLTLVTTDQAKHLQRARDYNQKAQTTVLQSPSPNALAKVDLDSAAIITRSMKIESSNLASVNELRRQAFSLFNRAVNHLQTKANSIDELNILAQAFVGCGKTAEALRSAGISSDSTGNIIDIPSRYYEAGSRCVEHALQLPAPKADSLAKLQQMGRQLARPSIAELP